MYHQKIDKIFKYLQKVLDIMEDILHVEYDANGRDYDKTLKRVVQIYALYIYLCWYKNLKKNTKLTCTKEPMLSPKRMKPWYSIMVKSSYI